MELKHTNGPWYIGSEHDIEHEEETYPEYKDDLDGWPFFVGIKQKNHVDYHVAIGIQSLKDARLIAVAPELLNIAKGMNDRLNEHFGITDAEEGGDFFHDEIRAVIAKAEGRAAK